MGFPKTVEDLAVDYVPHRVTVRLAMGGEPTLTVAMPRVEATGPSERQDANSHSYLDGVPYATNLQMGMGTGFVDPTEVTIEVGTGTAADELLPLGLPTTPYMATWGEGLSATFYVGAPIAD